MDYVVIGKVIDTFGLRGELKVEPFAPDEVFENLKKVYMKRVGGQYVPFKVTGVRKHRNFFLIKLKGYSSLEEVEQFRGAHMFLPEKALPRRGEGEFYAYELVGMEVITDHGKKLGRVKRVEDFGVYHMLILEDERLMVPFVEDIVLEVERDERVIKVRERFIPL